MFAELRLGEVFCHTANGVCNMSEGLLTHRVLPHEPFATLQSYVKEGGGAGLRAARQVAPDVVIAELADSGLRGRGGAGFPTAEKWRTVSAHRSDVLPTTVVVNAAEGEPGTFKDRAILRANPYAVIEGALIAAHVVGARTITIATKKRFATEVARLNEAWRDVTDANWCDGIGLRIVEGPSDYLFGEETALLEVLEGRAALPRTAPPWRRGVVDVVRDTTDLEHGSVAVADVRMATTLAGSLAPPALVNNVETLANVPAIVAKGATWFRSVGTVESPGTIVCTVTGAVLHPCVLEVELGTSLRSVIECAGGPIRDDGHVTGVMLGVSNAMIPAADFDTPITYEAMSLIGTGLGSASFIVMDDSTNPVAMAAGASRFLAVESCGQCTPCKADGLEIFERLRAIAVGNGTDDDLGIVQQRLVTIVDGARCNLARQHQIVVSSILRGFEDQVARTITQRADVHPPVLIAELVSLDGFTATLDDGFLAKRADWTYAPRVGADTSSAIDDPGVTPAERANASSPMTLQDLE